MSVTETLPPIPESRRKGGGNIGDSFSSISKLSSALPARYSALKQELVRGREQAILDSWYRLLHHLETKTLPEIKELNASIVPEVQYADIIANGNQLPAKAEVLLRSGGVIVVRGMVDRQQALDWKEQIMDYLKANPSTTGYPKTDPQILELYWSKAQLAARSHPNVMNVHCALNKVWSAGPEDEIVLSEPIVYADRVRIRSPGDKSFNLGPHLDGGSLERWEDNQYRNCYSDVLNGEWEKHKPYDASPRIGANVDLHMGPGGCSIFRTYQGWTSMSDCGPGEGTLRVLPDLVATTAYVILRPFVQKNSEGKWDIDNKSPMFHGAEMGQGQELSETDYPLLNANNFVSVPKVHPGDAVFWHCDVAHMVEAEHKGTHDSSVLYIPIVPLCENNAEYLRTQSAAFLNGTPPIDFPGGVGESKHIGRGMKEDIENGGLAAMGLEPFVPPSRISPAQLSVYENANKGFRK